MVMDDEHAQPEVDERVRVALAPDDAASRRVVAQAFADAEVLARRRLPIGGVAVAIAVVCAAAIAVVVLSRSQAVSPALSQPAALAITGRGSVLVVESGDGRRWIVGPPAPATTGSYVIVVPR
jgi:hypothetical protein